MKANGIRTTRYVGHLRAYLYQREGNKKPFGLAFPGSKIAWFASDIAREKVLLRIAKKNGEGKRKYNARIKEAIFVCQCGCNETFTAPFKTRKPKFKDDTHKKKFEAERRADKRAARMKELLGKQRDRRLAEKKLKSVSSEVQRARRVGRGAGRGEGGGGVPPHHTNPQDVGLYADHPEPERSKKRRASRLPVVDTGAQE